MMTTRANMSAVAITTRTCMSIAWLRMTESLAYNDLYKRLRRVPRASADPTNFVHPFNCITQPLSLHSNIHHLTTFTTYQYIFTN